MFPEIKCSNLDCGLMGLIVVCALVLIFRKEGFDTSVGVRSQVGDATNLDTTLGAGGSFPGDVYNCSQPILMVQPDNAYTWGDSKDYIDDKSLAFAKSIGKGIENLSDAELRGPKTLLDTQQKVNRLTEQQIRDVVRMNMDKFPLVSNSQLSSPDLTGTLRASVNKYVMATLNKNLQLRVPAVWLKDGFLNDPSVQYGYYNKSGVSAMANRGAAFEPFDTNSESTLAATMNGYNAFANSTISHLRDKKY